MIVATRKRIITMANIQTLYPSRRRRRVQILASVVARLINGDVPSNFVCKFVVETLFQFIPGIGAARYPGDKLLFFPTRHEPPRNSVSDTSCNRACHAVKVLVVARGYP